MSGVHVCNVLLLLVLESRAKLSRLSLNVWCRRVAQRPYDHSLCACLLDSIFDVRFARFEGSARLNHCILDISCIKIRNGVTSSSVEAYDFKFPPQPLFGFRSIILWNHPPQKHTQLCVPVLRHARQLLLAHDAQQGARRSHRVAELEALLGQVTTIKFNDLVTQAETIREFNSRAYTRASEQIDIDQTQHTQHGLRLIGYSRGGQARAGQAAEAWSAA